MVNVSVKNIIKKCKYVNIAYMLDVILIVYFNYIQYTYNNTVFLLY